MQLLANTSGACLKRSDGEKLNIADAALAWDEEGLPKFSNKGLTKKTNAMAIR